MDNKIIKVLLGDRFLGDTLISPVYTIKTLKDYGNVVLKQYSLLNPQNFVVDIYLNPQTKLDLSLIGDDLVLGPYWNQFTDPILHIREITRKENQGFTGNKDTDKIIIDLLDDESLLSLCQVNKHLTGICNNEKFWKERLKKNFGIYHIITNPNGDRNWKQQYIKVLNNKYNIYKSKERSNIHITEALYISETPISPEDTIFIKHIEKPKKGKDGIFYAVMDLSNGTLLSGLFANRSEFNKFYKDNFRKKYGKLHEQLTQARIYIK